jgi:AcrR family transcriptional regulator
VNTSETSAVHGDEPDQVHRALLDAAHAILATEGPAALTVRRIAADAGVSTINVYSRFGGKDGVLDALYVTGFQMLIDALDEVPRSPHGHAELMAATRAYRRFAVTNPTFYTIMFERIFERGVHGFHPSQEATEVAVAALGALTGTVERAMSAGVLGEGDPFATAVTLWATCHGLVSLELAGTAPPSVDWDATCEHTFTALFRGLAADGWGATGGLS